MTKSIISYLPLLCIVAGVIYTSSINTGAEQKQAAASNQTDIIESSPDIDEIQDRIDKRKQDLIEDSKEEEIEELKAKIKSLDSKVSQLQNDDNVKQDKKIKLPNPPPKGSYHSKVTIGKFSVAMRVEPLISAAIMHRVPSESIVYVIDKYDWEQRYCLVYFNRRFGYIRGTALYGSPSGY